jgi:hypothetical protein
MPFLPSEAEETKLVVNNEMKDVLVFHYLPILWYKHPIPNDVREFWYYQRPDILEYMRNAYKDLNLQLLPDKITQELSQNVELKDQTQNLTEYVSTELVSKITFYDFDLWRTSFVNSFHNILN